MMSEINKKTFYRYLSQDPLSYERFCHRDKNLPYRYGLKEKKRFYLLIKTAEKYFEKDRNIKVLDIGVFPGTLIRILKEYLTAYNFTIYGVGLSPPKEFVEIMGKEYNVSIESVNLDPSSFDLKDMNYTNRISLDDNSIDIIFCTEIIEHLINPLHMIKETHRLLKNNGILVISTPNVTRIGSIFKLLSGNNNIDNIEAIYAEKEGKWRPHIREYSLNELKVLLHRQGFKIVETSFYNSYGLFSNKEIKLILKECIKAPFYLIPYYRGGVILLGRKTP